MKKKKSSSTIKCNSSSRKKYWLQFVCMNLWNHTKYDQEMVFNADVWNTVKRLQMFSQLPHRDDSVMTKILNTTLLRLLTLGADSYTAAKHSLPRQFEDAPRTSLLEPQKTPSRMKGWGSLWESEANPKRERERELGHISITPVPDKYITQSCWG